MRRVLLLIPATAYRTADFLAAGARLAVDVTVATDRSAAFAGRLPDALWVLDFDDPHAAARAVVERVRGSRPFDAVVPVDDRTAVAAATIGAALGLPSQNPIEAVLAARDKVRFREALGAAGIPGPRHWLFRGGDDPATCARKVDYPCVLKPTVLSASRGVMRADDPAGFVAAFDRLRAILALPDVAPQVGPIERAPILVETFVAGAEYALEGLVLAGELNTLALFDKPDPLDGPFFEETIYVTPSRLPLAEQARIARTVTHAARALGLREGPLHAEVRVNSGGVFPIEIAARTIGGLCARTLRFGTGLSLEEIVLRHALSLGIVSLEREARAAGVLMLPIPRRGVLAQVRGIDAARAVPGIDEVTITAHAGQTLVPLPEGASYLGFVFARAGDPAGVEAALREARARLEVVYLDAW